MADYDPDVFGAPKAPKIDKDVFAEPKKAAPVVQQKPEPVTDFSGNLLFATPLGTLDTRIPLPGWFNKGLAQIGSGIADWGLGSRQIMASDKPKTASDLVTGQTEASRLRQEVEEKRKLDQQLNTGLAGGINHFVGKALPAFAIPQAAGAPILSAAAAGGVSGAFEPTGNGESRLSNTALGTGLGTVLPAAAALSRVSLRPDELTQQLARTAQQYGIPLSLADITNSKMVKAARNLTNDIPVIGSAGNALKEQQQQALNRAVGGTFGSPEARLTPEVMTAAQRRMGAEFDRIWGQNNLEVDAQLFQRLQAMRASAADLPREQSARITAQLDDFLSRAQPGQNGAPIISGDTANAFQQWLRERGASNDAVARDAQELRRSIIGAFNRSIAPEDAAALTLNREQYKAFKTVQPLLNKGEAGVAGRVDGDIPAALLPGAVSQSYRNLSGQVDQPALADLAKISGRFLVDRTPQTGGSNRAMLQNAGLLGFGAGAYAEPLSAAAVAGGTYALNRALNSPALGESLVNNRRAVGLLESPDASRATKEALALALQRSPLGLLGMVSID